MKRVDSRSNKKRAYLDSLIEEALVDAFGDDEQRGSFLVMLQDHIALPCPASVVGSPVTVMEFDTDDDRLFARCERGKNVYSVDVLDLEFGTDTPEAEWIAAYRQWSGGG